MDHRPSDGAARVIKSYTDLLAWQKSHELVIAIHALTKNLPIDERYGLISQMRRSAVSVTSNLAERFSRWGNKEKNQFYSMSSASLSELENQLIIARDVGYVSAEKFEQVFGLSTRAHQLINGLRRSNRSKTPTSIVEHQSSGY